MSSAGDSSDDDYEDLYAELAIAEPIGSWHITTRSKQLRAASRAERSDRRMQTKLERARLKAQPDLDRRCRTAVLCVCEILMMTQTDSITERMFYDTVERVLGRSLGCWKSPWDRPVCTTLAYREIPGVLEFIRIIRTHQGSSGALTQALRPVFDYALFGTA